MRPSIRELVVAIAFGSIVYRAQGQITQRQRPGVGHHATPCCDEPSRSDPFPFFGTPGVLPRYARQNVRRHCLSFGIPCVGKRSRRFIWALRKLEDSGLGPALRD